VLYMVIRVVRLLCKGRTWRLSAAALHPICRPGSRGTTRLLLARQKFLAVFRRLFGRESVTRGVFGHHSRNEEVQQVIFTTGFGAAATHFESAKGMAPDNRAGARAIDIDISRLQLGFNALDIGRAAREKSAGQRVIGAVCYFEGFIEIAHF